MRWPWWRRKETGASLVPCWQFGLEFRVFHPQFSADRAYRLVALSDYGPATEAYLWFLTEWGGLWAVRQSRCLHVGADGSRPLRGGERVEMPSVKPRSDWG